MKPTFIGMQECPGKKPMALFNLNEPLSNHPVGSTVSADTLIKHGHCPLELAIASRNKAFLEFVEHEFWEEYQAASGSPVLNLLLGRSIEKRDEWIKVSDALRKLNHA